MSSSQGDIALIGSSVTLPNGRVIGSRLVKRWRRGLPRGVDYPVDDIGIYTRPGHKAGNIQIDSRHLATPHDMYINDSLPGTIAAYRRLYDSISSAPSLSSPSKSGTKPLALAQLSHPGLQSSSIISMARLPWHPAQAPISARPDLGSSLLGSLLARTFWPVRSKCLNVDEWLEVVRRFVDGARMMEQAGWDGVQIHAAHGYLLAEYLSALTNPDPEPLPGVPADLPLRLHLLYLILHGVYEATEKSFILAVKINSSDFAQGGLDEEQSSEIIKTIVSWGIIDILEVSGGTYATPAFATSERPAGQNAGSTRQSLFSHFTSALLPHLPSPPEGPAIILTGGMHDRNLIATSLRERACDLAGIGRPACLNPHIPDQILLNPELSDSEAGLATVDHIPGSGFFKWLSAARSSSSPSKSGTQSGTSEVSDPYETNAFGPLADKKARRGTGGVPLVGASISILWHEMQICRLGRGVRPDPTTNWLIGLWIEFVWWGLFKGGPLGWYKSYQT